MLCLGACSDKPDSETGEVHLQARAINAGSAAQTTPRLAPTSTVVPLASAATHTIDPSTYRIHQFVSGPAIEAKISIVGIQAIGETPDKGAILFGPPDWSGPGIEITLTNGTVDLAAAGIELNRIPVGHYKGIHFFFGRVAKLKGCVSGTFDAMAAVSGTYNGATYTTDALTAGTHQFCTIASKSVIEHYNGTETPSGPVGTDAEYEAQATPEDVEFDVGTGFRLQSGSYPSSAADVRAASSGIDAVSEFDVDADTPVQLTLVVDMNRLLQFWPNITFNGNAQFQPPQPQAYPVGTSYFYSDGFLRSIGLFVGQPGSVEGYQLNSEICQDVVACSSGAPRDLSRGWMTLIRDANGKIGAGMLAPDDAPGSVHGDLIPTMTTDTAGTVHISLGLYRDTVAEQGYIDDFHFKNVNDTEDSASAYPVHGNGPVDGLGPFPLWYVRKL
ncbi:MAG TPA: hypothetical protein VL326_17935 [Kofleriaceae bacterium]|nr:hypothetical protein [Kofleriaceae bacterium]